MKKSAILILLAITLVFSSFVAGVYVGRNFDYAKVQISTTVPPGPSDEEGSSTTTKPSSIKPSDSSDPTASASVSPSPTFPININTATVEELDLLPGIGPVLAQRIIDYRTEYGNYTSAEDLLYVDGIGEKTLAKILEFITV